MASTTAPWTLEKPTALLVLADGTVIQGRGLGATGSAVAEVCFNTALTGYEEILTDPSYAGQIVTFTFPHIGNVGTNDEDIEDLTPLARAGAVEPRQGSGTFVSVPIKRLPVSQSLSKDSPDAAIASQIAGRHAGTASSAMRIAVT